MMRAGPAAMEKELERVLASPEFVRSPRLTRFLRFAVKETLEGRSKLLKEYVIGVHVYERGEGFDPRVDPIVRVQARNLRARLARYYAGPGANDAVRIDVPKRTYVPVFEDRRPAFSTTASRAMLMA